MWRIGTRARVFLRLGATDMRKAIDGLSVVVAQELAEQPASGDLYVFCNRAGNIVKILYWDRNGFCLWQKRLEKNRFKWPRRDKDLLEIDRTALGWLIAGLDIAQAHARLPYPTVT